MKYSKNKYGNFSIITIILIANAVYWLKNPEQSGVTMKKPVEVSGKELNDEKVEIKFIPDGDTVHLSDGRKVRIYGIDTPEIYHKQKNPSEIGVASRKYFISILKNKKVLLRINAENQLDQYERILGDLIVDGQSVSKMMVENGYAYTYADINQDLKNQLIMLEGNAKKNELGIWKMNPEKDFFESYSFLIKNDSIENLINSDVVVKGIVKAFNKNSFVIKAIIKTKSFEIPITLKSEHWHHFDENQLSEKKWLNKSIWVIGRLSLYKEHYEVLFKYPHQIILE